MRQLGQGITDLFGQFARWSQHQSPRRFWPRHGIYCQHLGHQWQAKRCGLTASGLRQTHDVTPIQRDRDRMALDRGWFGDTQFIQTANQFFWQAHHFKLRQNTSSQTSRKAQGQCVLSALP